MGFLTGIMASSPPPLGSTRSKVEGEGEPGHSPLSPLGKAWGFTWVKTCSEMGRFFFGDAWDVVECWVNRDTGF